MRATLTFLGTGTSMGVPTLGCTCAVCRSAITLTEPKNRRTRPSVRLEYGGHVVLIDTGPDFHAQAVREDVTRVDAVLYTHHHADHILGMDDLRPLSFRLVEGIPLYADEATSAVLTRVFEYTFRKENRYPTSARVSLKPLPESPGVIHLFGADFQRVDITHGRETIAGFRFGSAAYLTDMSDIPEHSMDLLLGLDILVVDALRREPHPSHSHLQKSVDVVQRLKPRQAYFTHMSHELDHNATEAELPANIRLAYDGLKLDFDIA